MKNMRWMRGQLCGWLLTLCVLLALVSAVSAIGARRSAAQTPAYRIVQSATGKLATLKEIVEAMGAVDVVFIGELHNDPTAHLLEAQLLEAAFERYGRGNGSGSHTANNGNAANNQSRVVALSLEMFERDAQTELNEYLAGLITERQFLLSSRPWSNYAKDYRPLVEFARANNLNVIAANAPERYVNRVARLGAVSLNELSAAAKNWIAPLPLSPASAAYAAKFKAFLGADQSGHMAHGGSGNGIDAAARLIEAQGLRDATMGYAIAEKLKAQAGALVLHVNGGFHSNGRLGTPEQLLRYRTQTRLMVVDIVTGDTFDEAEAKRTGRAGDFTIITDASAPRSF
ncbi:MAG: ChaN family lipoprotein [Pyrinomonadaceae bacterium]